MSIDRQEDMEGIERAGRLSGYMEETDGYMPS
jgi:hypothetical protein